MSPQPAINRGPVVQSGAPAYLVDGAPHRTEPRGGGSNSISTVKGGQVEASADRIRARCNRDHGNRAVSAIIDHTCLACPMNPVIISTKWRRTLHLTHTTEMLTFEVGGLESWLNVALSSSLQPRDALGVTWWSHLVPRYPARYPQLSRAGLEEVQR
jgi:hypothetical protein